MRRLPRAKGLAHWRRVAAAHGARAAALGRLLPLAKGLAHWRRVAAAAAAWGRWVGRAVHEPALGDDRRWAVARWQQAADTRALSQLAARWWRGRALQRR